jgi:hypothetical protein
VEGRSQPANPAKLRGREGEGDKDCKGGVTTPGLEEVSEMSVTCEGVEQWLTTTKRGPVVRGTSFSMEDE